LIRWGKFPEHKQLFAASVEKIYAVYLIDGVVISTNYAFDVRWTTIVVRALLTKHSDKRA
jgi:hypothetical protein